MQSKTGQWWLNWNHDAYLLSLNSWGTLWGSNHPTKGSNSWLGYIFSGFLTKQPINFEGSNMPPSLWTLTVTPSANRHVSDLFNCYTRQLFVANYSTPICVTADVSYRQTRAWFLPPHLVDTCICSRSFPLPVSFCAASQCLQSPCTSNAKTQASVRLIQTPSTACVAMLAVHSQCLSVTLLESYRTCLWCIVGGNVSDPLDWCKGQLSVVTYPVAQSV